MKDTATDFRKLIADLTVKLAATEKHLTGLREARRQHALAAASGDGRAQKEIRIIDGKLAAAGGDCETISAALEEAEKERAEADARAIEEDRQRRISEAHKIAIELQEASAEADRLMMLLAKSLANRDRIIDRLAATNAVYPGVLNALRRASRIRSAAWHAGLGERLGCETVSGPQRQPLGEADVVRRDLITGRSHAVGITHNANEAA